MIYVFLIFFCLDLPVEIATDKGIVCIYKYDQQNWPYPSPSITFSYHHVLILLYKPRTTVLQMPLWAQIMYNCLDYIKSPTIIVIRMSTIMMIHSYLRHLKKLPFFLFL